MDKRECKERQTDKLSYKITTTAGIITAVSIIGGAILYVGSFFFMPIEAGENLKKEQDVKIELLQFKQNETDKCLVEIRNDTKWIKEGITDIKGRLK